MNTSNDSKLNGIVTAIGIMVLLLGTATGNAYVMFAAAIAAIATVAVIGQRAIGWRVLFCLTAAAATAFAIAIGISKF